MTTDLDIRTLLATAVASAPQAPGVEDIAVPLVPDADHSPTSWMRAGAVLAVAAALVGAVAVANHDGGERRTSGSGIETGTDARGLAQHALPTVLPDGWALLDVSETATSGSGEVSQPAGQLFRRTSDGAAIRLGIDPGASAGVGRAEVVLDDQGATFEENDAEVRVEFAGVSATDGAAFVRSLTASGSGAGLRYETAEPGWVIEATTDYVAPHRSMEPSAALTYRTPDGVIVSFGLTEQDPLNEMWRFGTSVQVGNDAVFDSYYGVARGVGELVIDAGLDPDGDPKLRQQAISVLGSMTIVDDATWATASAKASERYRIAPTLGSIDIDGVTVTLHDDGEVMSLCATDADTTACHPDRNALWGSQPIGRFSTDLIVNGRWIAAGATDVDTDDFLDVETDAGIPTEFGSALDGQRTIYAAAMPAGVESVSITTRDRVDGDSISVLDRPVR